MPNMYSRMVCNQEQFLVGQCLVGFHLQLLVFPFVYQFNSRIEALVHHLGNDYIVKKDFNIISPSCQKVFVVVVT